LGPAANEVLIGEDDIVAAAKTLVDSGKSLSKKTTAKNNVRKKSAPKKKVR